MDDGKVSRRGFLQAGAAAAATTAGPLAAMADEKKKKEDKSLPRRKLGRTGVEVTILNQGTALNIGERHLNMMHAEGS